MRCNALRIPEEELETGRKVQFMDYKWESRQNLYFGISESKEKQNFFFFLLWWYTIHTNLSIILYKICVFLKNLRVVNLGNIFLKDPTCFSQRKEIKPKMGRWRREKLLEFILKSVFMAEITLLQIPRFTSFHIKAILSWSKYLWPLIGIILIGWM